jgi:hypothetical protein
VSGEELDSRLYSALESLEQHGESKTMKASLQKDKRRSNQALGGRGDMPWYTIPNTR